MGNISVKLFFEFGPGVQGKMLFEDNSYLELWQPFCKDYDNFARRHYEEQFCEIISNLDQRLRGRYRSKSCLELW